MLEHYYGRIIDAHNHPDWHGHHLERFLANMDAHGIARTWLLAWEAPAGEYEPDYNFCTPSEVLGTVTGPIPFSRCLSYAERCRGGLCSGMCRTRGSPAPSSGCGRPSRSTACGCAAK